MLPLALCVTLDKSLAFLGGPQFLLVYTDASRRLWTVVVLLWFPRSAPGTPTSLPGREAPGRGGEEPRVPPRPTRPGAAAGAAATATAATRGRPRLHPSPARVHGLSDRLEAGGLRGKRPQVPGGGGDSAGGTDGTEGRLENSRREGQLTEHSPRQQCAGCWPRGNGRRARGERQPSPSHPSSPTYPLLACYGPQQGWAWG